MNKKALSFKIWLIIFSIFVIGLSFTSATSFQITVDKVKGFSEAITKNITPIHFADNWNDFWGFLYFANDGSLDDTDDSKLYNVKIDDGSLYVCERKIRWFYYNAERWEILWPLDKDTWPIADIDGMQNVEWWIYTLCRDWSYTRELAICEEKVDKEKDDCISDVGERFPYDNAYYGAVIHETNRDEKFSLIVGINYNTTPEKWITPKTTDNKFEFARTFMRVNNVYPVGFVYDYKGWVWFAWCEINDNRQITLRQVLSKLIGGKTLNDLFMINNGKLTPNEHELWPSLANNLTCDKFGRAWDSLSRVLVEWIVWLNRESSLGIQWNQTNSKMQYFASANINNATIINYAKRKSEILCRWKWITRESELSSALNGTQQVICTTVDVSASNASKASQNKKTLIVKKWKVTINPNNNQYYDIFINGWNLIIDENSATKNVFNIQWFTTSETSVDDFNDTVKENIDEETSTLNYKWDLSSVWVFIRWNFIVDGNVKSASDGGLKNKYFIYWKFTTKDTLTTLENTFKWRCNNWISNEDPQYYCPPSTDEYSNPYANASLVVIDQDYNSPLLK